MDDDMVSAEEAQRLASVDTKDDLRHWPTWSDAVHDLARTVVALHAEVEHLARERDDARTEAQGLRADAEVWRGAAEITAEDGKSYMRATDATIAHLRAALDAVTHAHERDILRLAKALGFDHEPPSDVNAMVAEVEAQRAIIEGRTTPPTDAEIDAHFLAGGSWVMTQENGTEHGTKNPDNMRRLVEFFGDEQVVYLPLLKGRPCAWPVVTP